MHLLELFTFNTTNDSVLFLNFKFEALSRPRAVEVWNDDNRRLGLNIEDLIDDEQKAGTEC